MTVWPRPTDRLRRLREAAYQRAFAPHTSPKEANWTHAFFELYADLPLPERQARSMAWALEHEPVYLFGDERIAGQTYQACPGAGAPDLHGSDPRWEEYAVFPVARRRVAERLPDNAAYARYFGDGAAPGHVAWDFGLLLQHGARGLIEQHRSAASAATDPQARQFHACVETAVDGILRWVDRHVEALRAAGLDDLAAVCERVPAGPATTFHEAVQAFHFQHLAVMFENPFGGNSPGRLDYYLWPYLEADLAAGRTTLDEARELLAELLLKMHERLGPADGWVEAMPIGGRKPDGTSAVNPVSALIVECMIELPQTHPSVYVLLDDDSPSEFVDLTVRYVVEGGNRAQVYGNDAVIAALHRDGVALDDARLWTAGGCMEVSPQGCQGDLLFAFAHNVARTLELVLNGGCLLQTAERAIEHDRALPDYATFDDLWNAFATELHRELSILLRRLDTYLDAYAEFRPSFLLSSMVHDCLERGRAINDGGARYPVYGGSGVGIPNVGDSLYALQQVVYEPRRWSASEVLAALRADFGGHDRLRRDLLAVPKYGQDHAGADAMVDRVLLLFADLLRAHRNPRGGHAKPVILGFTWVVSMGQQTGALPDGRHSGRPLAHGLSPQHGATTRGIASAFRSATALSLQEIGGSAGMMWDIEADLAQPDYVKPILQTYLAQGGHIFQGNTVDTATLRRAQEHPDEYPHLMARVGGYSARFVSLSEATQQEIIERSQGSGSAPASTPFTRSTLSTDRPEGDAPWTG